MKLVNILNSFTYNFLVLFMKIAGGHTLKLLVYIISNNVDDPL
jgi:hypothetical protein